MSTPTPTKSETPLTDEQAFQIVVRGLAGQGWKRSMDGHSGMCAYRGAYGAKCGAGHVLTDESWREGINTHSVGQALLKGADFQGLDKEMLRGIQEDHDNGREPEKMRKAFIARGLTRNWAWPEDVPQEGPL